VQSHGYWRIKGIAEPMELFEAGDESAPFAPPPDNAKLYRVVRRNGLWLPLLEVSHGLPAERDAFVGRRDALDDLARRFAAGARLVSLVGVGGTGKTRLATHFAWTWLGDFPGGAWFCDLSAARNLDGIVHAVAQSLDVPLGAEDPIQQLGHAIAGRGPCLVILDNFEQITRHAQDTLGFWLDRCREARFLVTTREVLGLPGEEALALAPLGPEDAALLFNRRAASAKRDFHPSTEDQAAVAPLVRLLDGLPLAIELAAARVRVMPPKTLLARMDKRFKLLVAAGGRRDRQATLRAAFDWSWDLLTDAEKAALAQLSVFEGGFTLEAAEAVLDLSGIAPDAWVVDVLQSLVDKSFVRTIVEARFDLLGSVQEYAAEHLQTPLRWPGSGEAALRGAIQRHGAFFAKMDGLPARTSADIDNLIVACRRATSSGQQDLAVATLEVAWGILRLRGPFGTGVELGLALAALPQLKTDAVARVSRVAGCALDASGRVSEARQHLLAALACARKAGDPRLLAQVLTAMGEFHSNQAHLDEAKLCHTEALDLALRIGDRAIECEAMNGLGTVSIDLGRLEQARSHYLAALHTARVGGDLRWECGVLGNLGGLLFNQGQLGEAATHFEASLKVARELGHRGWEGNALCNLGALHLNQGLLHEALAELEAALLLARSTGHIRLECTVRCNLGLVRFGLHALIEAQEHYDSALTLARALLDRRCEGLFLGYRAQLLGYRKHFEEARLNLAQGEMLLRQVDDRFSLSLLYCHRAEVEYLAGSPQAARAAYDLARKAEAGLGSGEASELGVALRKVATLLNAPGSCD
jgi:predicted ATPase